MNILTSILTVAAVGLGATNMYLRSELAAERTTNAVAHCPQLAVARSPSDSGDDPRNVGTDHDPPTQSNANSYVASVVEINSGNLVTQPAPTSTTTPAARSEATRARAAAALRRLYDNLSRDLSLSPEQEAQVLQLLLDQQTGQMEMFRKLARDPAAMNQAMTELRDKSQTQLMTALGDKYLAFDDYQKSLGERMQIEQAALQLEAAGVPLRDDQRRRLLDAMVVERDHTLRPAWTPGMPPEQMLTQQREWQDDYDQRVRDRLSGVLDSEQLKQYDVYLNLQSRQRQRQLETWRESRQPPPLGGAPSGAM